MLELLSQYAHSHDITVEPGFKPKDIRWSIALDSKAGFLGLVELGQPAQKGNRGRTFPKCPDLSQAELISGPTARSHFLVDTAEVVALYEASGENNKIRDKHQDFIGKFTEAGKIMPSLARIAEILNNDDTIHNIQSAMRTSKVKANDKVTFHLDGEFPLEKDNWHAWWRSFRKNLSGEPAGTEKESSMRCFVTGELVAPLKTQPKIEGLAGVGGQPSGDVLIGFDKEAYRSYGLEQSTNAAVSEEAASAYRAGLNELIKNHSQRLAGTRVIHWFKEKVAVIEDPLEWLVEPPEISELDAQHAAGKLLNSIHTGERADLTENYYYTLTLSGAGGRVMVRDWMEGQFKELADNIDQWFTDLSIVQKSGDSNAHYPKLISVLGSIVGDLKDLSSPIVTKLWRVAVRNEPIPYFILSQSLTRRKIEVIRDQILNTTGIGLIKAYHIRKYKREGNNTMAEMIKPVLNEEFPSPAYHCGRLMAVLAELQRAALGDVGAGVVQRYYAAASTTPALVLGRLTRTSQFHLNKLEPGLAYWYESKIAGIWSCLKEAPPRTLSLEEQSLFALGYYQQLANLRTKKTDN